MASVSEIQDLYKTRFGRDVGDIDQEGMDYWTNSNLSQADMTKSFDDIYKTTYGKEYSAPQTEKWTYDNPQGFVSNTQSQRTAIETATPQPAYVPPTYVPPSTSNVVTQSPNWATQSGQTQNTTPTKVTDAQIYDLYKTRFNRGTGDIDAQGMDYWRDLANKGTSLSDMTASFNNIYKDTYGNNYSTPNTGTPWTPTNTQVPPPTNTQVPPPTNTPEPPPTNTPEPASLLTKTDVESYTPDTITPEIQEIDPNALALNQLKAQLDPDSMLMRDAQTKALQAQNARGTVNSTMGIRAGQAGMMDAAKDYVLNDANANLSQQQANMSYLNDAINTNALWNTQASSAQADALNNFNLNLINNQHGLNLANLNASNEGWLAGVKGEIAGGLQNAEFASNQAIAAMNNANSLAKIDLDAQGKLELQTLKDQATSALKTQSGQIELAVAELNNAAQLAWNKYNSDIDFSQQMSINETNKINNRNTAIANAIANSEDADEASGRVQLLLNNFGDQDNYNSAIAEGDLTLSETEDIIPTEFEGFTYTSYDGDRYRWDYDNNEYIPSI